MTMNSAVDLDFAVVDGIADSVLQSQAALDQLKSLVSDLIDTHPTVEQSLTEANIDREALRRQAYSSLEDGDPRIDEKFQELMALNEQVTAEAWSYPHSGWILVPLAFTALFTLLAAIGTVGALILTAFGVLSSTPWMVLAAATGVLIGLTLLLNAVDDQLRSRHQTRSGQRERWGELDRLTAELDDRLISLIILTSMDKLWTPSFDAVDEDRVVIMDATALSTRVTREKRIQTESYRRVLTSLQRSGGAAVGLRGSRGVGKTELLSSLCGTEGDDNVVGIIISAPVVYEPVAFLRLLTRRLCEEVLSLSEPKMAPLHRLGLWWALTWVLGLGALVASAVMLFNVAAEDLAVGRTTVAYGLAVGGLALLMLLPAVVLFRRVRHRSIRGALSGVTGRGSGSSESSETAQAVQGLARSEAGKKAAELLDRIRWTEARSMQGEASITIRGIGGKLAKGRTLTQLPLTEADLTAELTDLIATLSQGGYRVRIGIDELDKLRTDDAHSPDANSASRFLNSIKLLFTIRDCSFIVTISDEAWSHFGGRGLAVRDVFDSSLDAVISVKPLEFVDSRRFIARRGEHMTDTEVLLCHCLSGGLPRDLLRYSRLLGEVNAQQRGKAALIDLIPALLTLDRLERVSAILEGRNDWPADESALVTELETMATLSWDDDSARRAICAFVGCDGAFVRGDQSTPASEATGDGDTAALQATVARRRSYTYLFFLCTVHDAFVDGHLTDGDPQLLQFDALTEARRKIELDPNAGWRAIADARDALGMPAINSDRRADATLHRSSVGTSGA